MHQFRAIFGFIGMLLFGVSAVIWVTLVLLPTMSGGQVAADLGTLIFWTVFALLAWRIGGGKGWGFAAPPEKPGK
jgi:hypothetical protein